MQALVWYGTTGMVVGVAAAVYLFLLTWALLVTNKNAYIGIRR